MSERMSERYVRKNVRRYVRNHVRRCARKNVKRYVPKNVGRYARRYSRKNVKRYVRKNVRRYVRKNVRRYVRRNVRKICQKICQKSCQKKGQKECQKICQKECQKICQKDVRKNVRRYGRKNVKRYVRKNGKRYVRKNVRRYKDSCLHLVVSILLIASCFFCFILAHCSVALPASTVGSTLFLCKEVSLVWQPWRRLWWNVLRRSSLGLPIRWPKELSMCGATSWLLLVLSACTCAWSRLALHMLGIWCLSWKKSWRETSGMWHMKGRPVPNAEGEQEAGEARCSLSYFGLVLGGWSARVGDKWCAEQSHLHRRSERTTVASVGLHGLHTPWDVVVAP